MAIRLTTPEPKDVAQDQAVQVIVLTVPHEYVAGEVKIKANGVYLTGSVATYNTVGEVINTDKFNIPLVDIPNQGITMLKQLYEWMEAQAVSKGIIGAGVAEALEKPVIPIP